MTGERLYTLAEARVALIRQECAARGHDFLITFVGVKPVALSCQRGCGESFDVTAKP